MSSRQLILELTLEHSPGWIIDETRKKCILYAIQTKDLNFLRILTQTIHPFINTCEYLECAAGIENNIPVIKYLLSLNCPVDQLKVLLSAVENTAFNNLKFFHEKMEFPIDDNYQLFSSAAGAEDNIPILEYLMSLNCPTVHLYTSRSVARNGAVNNSKWLLDNGFSIKSQDIFDAAIQSGSLEVLKGLKGSTLFTNSFLENCSIETIEWLLQQGIRIIPIIHVSKALPWKF